MKNNKTTYEVYTYFGRVVCRIDEDDHPLWLNALCEAQRACAKYIRETGNDAWVRLV
jgi:hypothetical protein